VRALHRWYVSLENMTHLAGALPQEAPFVVPFAAFRLVPSNVFLSKASGCRRLTANTQEARFHLESEHLTAHLLVKSSLGAFVVEQTFVLATRMPSEAAPCEIQAGRGLPTRFGWLLKFRKLAKVERGGGGKSGLIMCSVTPVDKSLLALVWTLGTLFEFWMVAVAGILAP
jgi:hypothetical protein